MTEIVKSLVEAFKCLFDVFNGRLIKLVLPSSSAGRWYWHLAIKGHVPVAPNRHPQSGHLKVADGSCGCMKLTLNSFPSFSKVNPSHHFPSWMQAACWPTCKSGIVAEASEWNVGPSLEILLICSRFPNGTN